MKTQNILIGVGVGVVVMTTFILLFRKLRLTDFKRRLIDNANREWELWGKPLYRLGEKVNAGETECFYIYKQRVGEYWKKGANKNLDGCDKSVPWSAAFISFIMKKTGAGNEFVYSSAHTNYIRDAIKNTKSGKKHTFMAYRLSEKPVSLGSLVCYSRQSGVNYNTTSSYKSHCDIVVKVNKRKGTAEVIGGNVSDGVSKKVVSIDKDGYLIDKNNDWFTIIKINK